MAPYFAAATSATPREDGIDHHDVMRRAFVLPRKSIRPRRPRENLRKTHDAKSGRHESSYRRPADAITPPRYCFAAMSREERRRDMIR